MKTEKKKTQIRKTYRCLKERPKTTKMIQVESGIPRENLTRYIAYLEDHNLVATVERKPCEITGYTAKYYSTEKKYLSPVKQPTLFPEQTKSRAYQV